MLLYASREEQLECKKWTVVQSYKFIFENRHLNLRFVLLTKNHLIAVLKLGGLDFVNILFSFTKFMYITWKKSNMSKSMQLISKPCMVSLNCDLHQKIKMTQLLEQHHDWHCEMTSNATEQTWWWGQSSHEWILFLLFENVCHVSELGKGLSFSP